MFTSTADRVTRHTTFSAAERIQEKTEENIRYYRRHHDEIPMRLQELDREWDIERTLETGSASLTLLGLALGTTVNRKWYLLSFGVQAFFLQHAIQGWCPPLPMLRALGVRTTQEIEAERSVLTAILGSKSGAPVRATATN